tara:strand:- start:112 stop:471 length:360 start_codon:yes stop_codon:yes gene_type:complete
MKTRLLFLLFIAFTLGLEAQGDLQFNQVLTFSGNTTESNIYTVPAGKVAKITKAIETTSSSQYELKFKINGAYHKTESSNQNLLDGMWLKAGDFIGSKVGTDVYSNNWVLSIIEYNIVP